MSVGEFEIPQRGEARPIRADDEGLPEPITRLNRPVYLLIISGLLLALLFGLVAWLVLTLNGLAMPEGMAVVIGTIGGGIVGLLSVSGKS